jgi:L-threonylcarbamoyladenylate synthase
MCGSDAIARAAGILRDGGVVAFPTETVYGLGADATSDRAVARVFAVKGRPRFNPLIIHLADTAAARAHAALDRRAEALAAAFWPGPLTLVLAKLPTSTLSALALCGLPTVALRCPALALARRLLRAVGPLAAPSANSSGRISPTTAAHVAADLGDKVDMIVDGGPCPVGIESTIVDLTVSPAALLRPGAVTADDIEAVIGSLGAAAPGAMPKAPGMLARHYAPRTPLRLDAEAVGADEALLAFGPEPLAGAAASANLSPSGDLVEAAANLFSMLHRLDASGAAAIAVMPVPEAGLGAAINDRLRRAAAPTSHFGGSSGKARKG